MLPIVYDVVDRAKLRVEHSRLFEDLPREPSGRAIIADPRNDEHAVLAGLQAAFLLAHNHAVDRVRLQQPPVEPADVFDEARRLVTWHYQGMILHEFLPQLVGAETVARVLADGRRFYVRAGTTPSCRWSSRSPIA